MQAYTCLFSTDLARSMQSALKSGGYEPVAARSHDELRDFLLMHVDNANLQVLIVIQLSAASSGKDLIDTLEDSPVLRHQPVLFIADSGTQNEALNALEKLHGDVMLEPCSEREIRFRLKNVREETGRAVENLHLKEELSRIAQGEKLLLGAIDPETGIPGRAAYTQFLNREWRRCLRYERPVSLLRIASRYAAGVRADFKNLAEILESSVHRPGDLVCSLALGEFAAILSETDAKGARQVADRMIRILRNAEPADKGPWVSIGTGTVEPVEIYRGLRLGTVESPAIHILEHAAEKAMEEARSREGDSVVG